MKADSENLLELYQVKKHYPVRSAVFSRRKSSVKAVDGIDLQIRRGECLGLVGESGCGKTTLGKTILGLHDATGGRIYFSQTPEAVTRTEEAVAGNIAEAERLRRETDMTCMPRSHAKRLRRGLQMVFQDPSNSLDPRMLVKDIVTEPLSVGSLFPPRRYEQQALELLERVGLSREHLRRYPHEFSGGQRQRIAIARALSTNPEFILMDEPTSALDVSVQAQILNLMQRLQEEMGLAYLFVTHHLLVVKYITHRIAVMYLGKIVELSDTSGLFARPLHPYTMALLSAIPIPAPHSRREKIILTGDVPNPADPPAGCRFNPRCRHAVDRCRQTKPELTKADDGHLVACHRWAEL